MAMCLIKVYSIYRLYSILGLIKMGTVKVSNWKNDVLKIILMKNVECQSIDMNANGMFIGILVLFSK